MHFCRVTKDGFLFIYDNEVETEAILSFSKAVELKVFENISQSGVLDFTNVGHLDLIELSDIEMASLPHLDKKSPPKSNNESEDLTDDDDDDIKRRRPGSLKTLIPGVTPCKKEEPGCTGWRDGICINKECKVSYQKLCKHWYRLGGGRARCDKCYRMLQTRKRIKMKK